MLGTKEKEFGDTCPRRLAPLSLASWTVSAKAVANSAWSVVAFANVSLPCVGWSQRLPEHCEVVLSV